MREETKKALKEMNEKISRSATVYTVEIIRLNYETFQPEKYTTSVKSFNAELDKEELAKRLSVDSRGIVSVNKKSGTVYISLEKALQYGLFVYGEAEEE